MTHRLRTKVLVLRVSYLGYRYPIVEVVVSDATYNGLNSTDWENRARKFAGLSKQIKAVLTKEGYDMAGKFLNEKDVTIITIRPVRGAPPIEAEPF